MNYLVTQGPSWVAFLPRHESEHDIPTGIHIVQCWQPRDNHSGQCPSQLPLSLQLSCSDQGAAKQWTQKSSILSERSHCWVKERPWGRLQAPMRWNNHCIWSVHFWHRFVNAISAQKRGWWSCYTPITSLYDKLNMGSFSLAKRGFCRWRGCNVKVSLFLLFLLWEVGGYFDCCFIGLTMLLI